MMMTMTARMMMTEMTVGDIDENTSHWYGWLIIGCLG